jgi:Phosphotransferase enzyme family
VSEGPVSALRQHLDVSGVDEIAKDVWRSASWHELATSWLDEELASAGIRRTGSVEQPHLRPWATVLTAPTTQGPVWLKATGPAAAFEAGLYVLLSQVSPKRALAPIAVDTHRGWILLPDGGEPLGVRLAGADLADALAAVLRRYAELQRDFAPEAEAALALGVADMRPEVMPTRFAEAVEAVGPSVADRGDDGDREALREVAALHATYRSWCERLAESAGAASLDHNDLHPWNMLVPRLDRPDEVRFYDWGDAVIAHPFACMLVPLGWTQHRLSTSLDGPDLLRIRDAYLEMFSDLAPHAELVATLELACRVGKVARALTWARAVAQSDPDELDDHYARAPIACLRSLLDDSYLGGA